MNLYRKMAWALIISGLITTPLLAEAKSVVPVTPVTSTTIDMTNSCAKGGTRSVKGSYDMITGAIDVTTTLAACVLRNGQTHDGTTSTMGTLLETRTGYNIDLATNINTTITYKDGSILNRTCEITKKGVFSHATQMFDGTETRNNCTLAGKVREHENMIENLLRDITKSEVDGGDDSNNRAMPMRPGESD